MSAYGTFSPTARPPKGLANTVGAAHTRVRHVAGVQGKTSCTPLPPERWVASTCKRPSRYAVASQALTGFQLRPLRLVLLPPRRWRGVKGDEVVHFTLDALESTNTHRRGRWIGLPPAPAASQVMSGVWGKAPRLILFLKLLGWM